MSLRVREPNVPAPSITEGNWFQTRGWVDPPLQRGLATSTGAMLTPTSKTKEKPMPPPLPFDELSKSNYSDSNNFSMHDNRNSFQGHGVYFGHGLGKKLFHGKERQHNSEDIVSSSSLSEKHYTTSSGSTYAGQECTEPTGPGRRFPREHREPKEGSPGLSTTTTAWYQSPNASHMTDTQVLVSSQEPHLKANPWKYSYKPSGN